MKNFISPLLKWYFFNKREFPWRTEIYSHRSQWVYHTWICEVMSQQTLISVVLPKFKQFVEELPSLEQLATCSDEKLRSLWSGLGYYARARNLRNGAIYILNECHGEFPTTQQEWLKVPGCGEYTSSIIASICFQEYVPAIDGNVIRVASRLLGLTEHVWDKIGQRNISDFMKQVFQIFSKMETTNGLPGDLNQAFMDFGSMICKKQKPLCLECPIQQSCVAFEKQITEICPPIKPRREVQQEDIFAFALVNQKNKSCLLVERESGFLRKTLGFPLYAKKDGHSLNSLLNKISHSQIKVRTSESTFQHSITHHKITGYLTILESDWDEKTTSQFYSSMSLPEKKHWIPLPHLKNQLSSSLDLKVLKLLS